MVPDDPDLLDADDLASPQEVEEGLNRISRDAPIPKIIAALKRTDDSTLETLRSEAQAFVTQIVTALGMQQREMTPDEFLNYFSRAVVDPNGPTLRKELYEAMEWKRPPLTIVQQMILRRRQQQEVKSDK